MSGLPLTGLLRCAAWSLPTVTRGLAWFFWLGPKPLMFYSSRLILEKPRRALQVPVLLVMCTGNCAGMHAVSPIAIEWIKRTDNMQLSDLAHSSSLVLQTGAGALHSITQLLAGGNNDTYFGQSG